MTKAKPSALGANPLSQGIFSRTEPEPSPAPTPPAVQAPPTQPPKPTIKTQESRTKNLDSIEEKPELISSTVDSINKIQDSRKQNLGSRKKKTDSRKQKQESRFLEKGDREAVNLRLPLELNDWLNDLLRQGKRRHGSKIPKEVWVQAALELFQELPVDWYAIDSEASLRETLQTLKSRI